MGSKSAIGIGNGICFKQVRDKGGGSYIDPLVRDSIVGLWKSDQNTNESPTRNIIKNTIKDKGGDLELLNFGYKLNSGYGKYEEDFTSWAKYAGNFIITNNKVSWSAISNVGLFVETLHLIVNENFKEDINSFKIYLESDTEVKYRYIDSNGISRDMLLNNGENTLPHSYVSVGANGTHIGFYALTRLGKTYTIKQLPLYEGALVTDGVDDLITSTKTVKEMLGGSNEVTVVSMMLNLENEKITYTNQIRPFQNGYIRNNVISNTGGKCGIYGYKISDISDIFKNKISINDILGDRKDYNMDAGGTARIDGKFSVEGYCFNDGTIGEVSQVAWYWTIISKIALTTDQINQVISYFNLDKHVKPDVYYDVKKQGLSNDTPEADWYLKDFSGNGHDMTLYNFAKKLDSGVGKWATDYTAWTKIDGVVVTPTGFKIVEEISSDYWLLFLYNTVVPAHKIKVSGIPKGGTLKYAINSVILENGINELPEMEADSARGFTISMGTTQFSDWTGLLVEQIPDYEGALVSDGINDYGKVENLPIYKDYTVVADREMLGVTDGGVFLKGEGFREGAFSFDYTNESNSFGGSVQKLVDTKRLISYQSKYVNNGININAGTATDTDKLWLAKLGNSNRYSKLALWSFLLFPYSLSEFLLERQLKRYKLGTLYPDMVEFRPVIKSNASYDNIVFYYKNEKVENGTYFTAGSSIGMHIRLSSNPVNEIKAITVNGVPATFIYHDTNNNIYIYNFNLTSKSPQKIDITIDEYIRYEDIVQPYPAIINLKQDGKTITWGDKLKVGSEVTFVNHTNLLPDLYTVSGGVQYNGTFISWNTSIRVEKSMVFVNPHSYKKANEPNCILAPQTLRIPNSSYKILGYIPDLTGKGNHGRLNNFAYAGMSGANGYVEDFTKWRVSKSNIVSTISDSSIHFTHIGVNYGQTTAIFEAQATSNKKYNIKVRISGLTSNMRCFFNNTNEHSLQELVNGVNEISIDLIVGWYGFNINTLDGSVIGDCDITIQQIGEHEGSICFDGTDDHITISTLAHGGKQVLMKANLQSYDRYLYDQRNSWSQYLAIVSAGKTIAYEYSNKGGKTYIDGILNEHIIDKDLLNITHNITATNANIGVQYAPNIGTSFARDNFAQMALFDFMLFPDISNEEEIKELNDVMGIEGGYVESPNYYYDAYGKKNTDTDRNAKEPV